MERIVYCFSRSSGSHARRSQQVRSHVQTGPGSQVANDATATDSRADAARLARRRRAGTRVRLAVRGGAGQAGDTDPAGVVADVVAGVVAGAGVAGAAAAAAAAATAAPR